MTSNASNATPSNPFQDAVRSGVRDLSAVWWWFPTLGVAWTLFGTYVLSFRVGSLAAVAALAGVAFLFGGVTQLVVAARVQSWRWLFIVAGILGIAAGILTVVWPAITLYVVSRPGRLVPDHLRDHPPGGAGKPQASYWTQRRWETALVLGGGRSGLQCSCWSLLTSGWAKLHLP